MTPEERANHILAAILTGNIRAAADALRAAVAEEREAYARAVETATYRHWGDEAAEAAAAIRARP